MSGAKQKSLCYGGGTGSCDTGLSSHWTMTKHLILMSSNLCLRPFMHKTLNVLHTQVLTCRACGWLPVQCAAADWHLWALLPLHFEKGQGTDSEPFDGIAADHTLIASQNVLLSGSFKIGPLSLLVCFKGMNLYHKFDSVWTVSARFAVLE